MKTFTKPELKKLIKSIATDNRHLGEDKENMKRYIKKIKEEHKKEIEEIREERAKGAETVGVLLTDYEYMKSSRNEEVEKVFRLCTRNKNLEVENEILREQLASK